MHRREEEILDRYLRGRGQKVTKTRRTILRAFLSMEGHVTAERLFEASRRIDPGIGQATVFRTVRLLADAGLAREACQDEGARTYEHEYQHSHHDHLRCARCGRTVEFMDPAVERAQDAVFRRFGFIPTSHRMELVGLCPDCATGKNGPAPDGTERNGIADLRSAPERRSE